MTLLAAAPSTTDWFQAGAAALSTVVTIALVALAVRQMRFTRQQAEAASSQVTQMRADAQAASEHRQQEREGEAEAARRRDQAVQTQLAALGEITEATRDAARAQMQPIVFAHAHGPPLRGPDDNYDLSEGQVAFAYYLRNEGVGPALNVRHGVEVGGVISEFGEGMEVRALRAGETVPPVDEITGLPVVIRAFSAVFEERDLPANWAQLSRTYWARFDDPFGDGFVTNNPSDPRQSAAFERVSET